MPNLSRVQVIGHTGQEIELRYTPDGKEVANFSVAVATGKDETTWFRIALFGKTAKVAADYLKKGNAVYVEGDLKARKWKNKEGAEQTSLEVAGNKLVLLEKKREQPEEAEKPDPTDDDIPFN